jgi:phosphate starvation-inducible PhoH-like protein
MSFFTRLGIVYFFINDVNANSFVNHKRGLQLFMKKTKQYSPLYTPKTVNQEKYVNYLNNVNTKLIVSTGPAGCGKTLFACQKSIIQMKSEEINKIVITRPVVSVDEEIGFLPGNIIKKMDPWTKPLFDIFLEYYSKNELDLMLSNGKIEICPLAFMRGRTFKRSFIIADEMQNSTPNQMKMLVTRLGEDSRMVITGDLQQSDILTENGLNDFVTKIVNFNEEMDIIKIVKLESEDIERSNVVKKVIEIYDKKDKKNIIDNSTTKNLNFDAALIPINHISKNINLT